MPLANKDKKPLFIIYKYQLQQLKTTQTSTSFCLRENFQLIRATIGHRGFEKIPEVF